MFTVDKKWQCTRKKEIGHSLTSFDDLWNYFSIWRVFDFAKFMWRCQHCNIDSFHLVHISLHFFPYICSLYHLVSILCMLWKSWKHKVCAFAPSNQSGALFKLKSWARKQRIVRSKKQSLIETKKLWICHTYIMQ